MQTAKEKIHKKIPNCVIEFYDRKKYYLHATESLFDWFNASLMYNCHPKHLLPTIFSNSIYEST